MAQRIDKPCGPGKVFSHQAIPKSDADYNQPVLSSKEAKVDLNPRNIMEVSAGKILEEWPNRQSFVELFDIWLKMLK